MLLCAVAAYVFAGIVHCCKVARIHALALTISSASRATVEILVRYLSAGAIKWLISISTEVT